MCCWIREFLQGIVFQLWWLVVWQDNLLKGHVVLILVFWCCPLLLPLTPLLGWSYLRFNTVLSKYLVSWVHWIIYICPIINCGTTFANILYRNSSFVVVMSLLCKVFSSFLKMWRFGIISKITLSNILTITCVRRWYFIPVSRSTVPRLYLVCPIFTS